MKLNCFIFQKNTKVGDIKSNFIEIKKAYLYSVKRKCDLFLTPELSLCGYPPKDLLYREDFIKKINLFYKKLINLTVDKKTLLILLITNIKILLH